MGKERTLYESEKRRPTGEVVDFLQQLAHWLADRRLMITDEGEEVALNIPDEVVLEIELEEEDEGKKRVKRSLEVEITWIEERATGSSEKVTE